MVVNETVDPQTLPVDEIPLMESRRWRGRLMELLSPEGRHLVISR